MSSIAYLKHLPVDFIKIDGSFVKEILNSKVDRAMVEMMTKTAKIMQKQVIAELSKAPKFWKNCAGSGWTTFRATRSEGPSRSWRWIEACA